MSLDTDTTTSTERLALDKVGAFDVLLVANSHCKDVTHFLCWRIDCRHCEKTLAAHVGVEYVRGQIAVVRTTHTC